MSIEVKDLTGGEVCGAGLFDELMRSIKSQLLVEYDEGRVVGTDYANVLLGGIQATLQTSASFLLEYELKNQQIILLQEQVQGADLDNQLKQDQLLTAAKQRDLLDAQIAQVNQNILQSIEQTKLITQQTVQVVKQVELTTAQIVQVEAQTLLTGKQEDMVSAQIQTELANTETPTAGLSKAAYDKALAENGILVQKLETEKAQTIGTTETIGGLIGHEMSLKDVQANSFLRDAEQKAAKFYADTLAIAYSVSPSTIDPADWGLGEADSHEVMRKVQIGIGIENDPSPS